MINQINYKLRKHLRGAAMCLGLMFSASCVLADAVAAGLDRYNVVWTSPSTNALGSMPIGNGDIGINAWVEPSGDLVFYVSKTDAWDENGRLCKVGRVRVKFDPALAVTNGFRQELKLRDGVIAIEAGGQGAEVGDQRTTIRLWVDAHSPVVRMESESEQAVKCQAEVELWRLRERPFIKGEDDHSARLLEESAFKPTVLPDVVVPGEKARVAWYHRNTRSIYDLGLQVQHLEGLRGRFADPLLNHTFGASLAGTGFVREGERGLRSKNPAKAHVLSVTVLAAQTETPDAWLAQLDRLEKKSVPVRRAHEEWWQAFWNRSWIFVDGGPEAEVLTRGYVLTRFMNACSGRGGAPVKFNGSIFTVEHKPGVSPETWDGNPDYRRWGGNMWFQNTRLVYWTMLAAGDFDMMEPWFRMFRDALPLSKARIQEYFGFENAALFPETGHHWGLPSCGDYGWEKNKKRGYPNNPWIQRYWNGSLELVAIMLDRYDFTLDRAFAADTLVPLADPLISFLSQYWQKRDANGKIVFDPAQSLETWHVAVNPMPEIAGLWFVLPRLLALPADVTTENQRSRWQKMLGELPPVPSGVTNGTRVLLPAETYSIKKNRENPAMYAIFPYRLYGVGRPDLDVALATYHERGFRMNFGWCQDSIMAARLGLGDEAGRLVAERAAKTSKNHRFPSMWGPNFDWVPDMDHGNNILTTLQFMLLQADPPSPGNGGADGGKIRLLPAWPKQWNCEFKLHAPGQTTVEGKVENGRVVGLKVLPESRRQDIVLP